MLNVFAFSDCKLYDSTVATYFDFVQDIVEVVPPTVTIHNLHI